jgi:hypothetical protein
VHHGRLTVRSTSSELDVPRRLAKRGSRSFHPKAIGEPRIEGPACAGDSDDNLLQFGVVRNHADAISNLGMGRKRKRGIRTLTGFSKVVSP